MTLKKYENETFENKKRNIIKKLIDLTGKSIVSIITFSTLIGSIQLFFFAKAHNVKYIDLVNSGIALTFGATYSIFVIAIMSLYLVMAYVNSSQNDFLQNTLIKKSRIQKFKRRPLIPQFIFSIMLSTWPLAFLTEVIPYGYSLLITMFINLIALSIYHYKFTTHEQDRNPWYISSRKVFILTLLPATSISAVGLSLICGEKFLRDEFSGTQDWAAMITIMIILTFINYFSFTPNPSENKKETPFAIILIPLIFFLIFLTPNALSTYTPNTIIRMMDIGLTSRCYQVNNLNETRIPMALMKKYGNIIKLNITANFNDIFYIAQFGDKDMKAKYRFVAKDFHLIDCPRSQANMDTHYM